MTRARRNEKTRPSREGSLPVEKQLQMILISNERFGARVLQASAQPSLIFRA